MRLLPSQVAAAIRSIFPAHGDANPPTFDHSHTQIIAGLLDVVDAVPSELLPITPEELTDFVQARAAVTTFLQTCRTLATTRLACQESTLSNCGRSSKSVRTEQFLQLSAIWRLSAMRNCVRG
jgi:hypothetical protein